VVALVVWLLDVEAVRLRQVLAVTAPWPLSVSVVVLLLLGGALALHSVTRKA
jgi:hypothetical protein